MQGPETRLRKRIQKALLTRYPTGVFDKIHVSMFQNAGILDLNCCVEGLHIEIEIKTPTGKVSPAQLYRMTRIKKAGGYCGVATTPAEALQIVAEALREKKEKR
jgi:hypothetical protein